MQDFKLKPASKAEGFYKKTVIIALNSKLLRLSGNWNWEMHSTYIYCSNVMSFPWEFEGTKAIIHPDDVEKVNKSLNRLSDQSHINLEFRIITTYGEVHYISGNHIAEFEHEEYIIEPVKELFDEAVRIKELELVNGKLHLNKITSDYAEYMQLSGTWYVNVSENEYWYSDNVYRIFGLQPQSLNNNIHTFFSFIHPEDRSIVEAAFDTSIRERLPLHIRYRIISADGREKYILSISGWTNNFKGDHIITALLKDVTDNLEEERNSENKDAELFLQKHLLWLNESVANTGYFYFNFFTKKIIFSDNYYRLYGIKTNQGSVNFSTFLNYIHPEDQPHISTAFSKIVDEHIATDFEYRIIRNDGKMRFIKQKNKIITLSDEQVLIGVIHDLTKQKTIENKLKELKEHVSLRNFSIRETEQIANIGSWLWEINTGEIIWSHGLYLLLGYKPQSIELTQNRILSFIHPEDRKKFSEELGLVLRDQKESEFEFRMLSLGSIKHVRASFKLLNYEGKLFFVGTLRDRTKEYRMQQELFERIQIAESLTENLEDRIVITDANNSIIVWNHKCEETFHLSSEDALNKNFFDVFPSMKSELMVESFNKVLGGKKLFFPHQSYPLLREYFDLHLIPLENENNEVNGILHVMHDVTHEFKMQQNLADRLGFIESLVDASVDRIIALDRNMNYITWNRKCEEYYGIKKEDILGRNVMEVLPESLAQPSYDEFRRCLRGETVYISASEFSPGEYLDVYLVPVKDNANEVTALLWMMHDMTKEYELRKQQRRSKQILDVINESYYELDSKYRFTYINKSGEEFFLKSKDALIGKVIWEVFPEVVNKPIYHAIIKATEKRTAARGEYVSYPQNVTVFASISPIDDGIAVVFFDIQYIKDNELKLRNSLEQWRALVENSPDAISRWDEYGKLIFANSAFINRTGFSLYQMQGKTYEQMGIAKETAWPLSDKLTEVFQSKRESELYYSYTLSNGKSLNYYTRIVPEFGSDGVVVSVLAIARDITELKQIQSSLNQMNENLSVQNKIHEYAEEIALLGTWTWKPDSNEVYYSNNMFALFGLDSKSDLQNLETIARYIHPDDLEKFLSAFRALKGGKESNIEQYRIVRSDGTQRILRNKSKLHKTEKGEVIHIGTVQDITEETELNIEIVERSLYAETLIESSVDRIMTLDLNYKVVAWNKKSEETTGIKKQEIVGESIFKVFPQAADDPVMTNSVQRAINGEFVHIPDKKGLYSNKHYERFFVPLKNARNEVYAVLVIMHDISDSVKKARELKQMNQTLERKNEELEEKNEEITNFAFIASHDLKEPLRKIHTFSDWLLEKETKNLSAEGQTYLYKLAQSVKRMEMLIEDILVLTKIHADKHKNDTVSLAKVLGKVKNELSEKIEQSGAIIKSHSLPSLKGNFNQIFHLFKNLISNSIKFRTAGKKPEITITAEQVEANISDGVSTGGTYLKLTFSDNGIGINVKYFTKIFRVFQRLQGSNEVEGTGMGLAICKKIMENHNGAITLHSNEGEGAHFSCFFPLFVIVSS